MIPARRSRSRSPCTCCSSPWRPRWALGGTSTCAGGGGGGDGVICTKGATLDYLSFYNQFVKFEMHPAGGKIEASSYPHSCGYLQPGTWHHVALAFDHDQGVATLFTDGAACYTAGSKSGGLAPSSSDLEFGNWSGLLSDVRVYSGALGAGDVAALHSAGAPLYNATAYQVPTKQETEHLGLGWKPIPRGPADAAMHRAWLNYNTSAHAGPLHWATRIVWKGGAGSHPAVRTAARELAALLPWATAGDGAAAGQQPPRAAAGVVLLGTCDDPAVAQALGGAPAPAGAGRPQHVCAGPGAPASEAYTLRMTGDGSLVIAGGGPAGVLYGVFAVARMLQTQPHAPWPVGLDHTEGPATQVRLLNHWSQWRGLPCDAWMPPRSNHSEAPPGGGGGIFCDGADRTDSLFSWGDLEAPPPAPGNSTGLATLRAWARLLASVGINGLAPQDVNWFEPNNYLKHLTGVAALGSVLREYAIKLYWSPNYLLAPQQAVADALFAAVPDFGGYLLKLGSESQGGQPTPANVNAIARTLIRNATSGQSNGTVVLRGFIYGSACVLPAPLGTLVLVVFCFFLAAVACWHTPLTPGGTPALGGA